MDDPQRISQRILEMRQQVERMRTASANLLRSCDRAFFERKILDINRLADELERRAKGTTSASPDSMSKPAPGLGKPASGKPA